MKKFTSWETELWSYLDIGDRLFCPICAGCTKRKSDMVCTCPIFGTGSGGCGSSDKKCRSPDPPMLLKDSDRLPCKNTNAAFIQTLKPGRINELIELLSQKWLERLKIKQPPIPWSLVNQFAPAKNVSIRFLALNACHGAVWKIGESSWVVYINSKDNAIEKRFTIFHEAFHILAHQESHLIYRKNIQQIGSFSEYLADNFAFKFLMPQPWIKQDWKTIGNIKAIAQKYQVSSKAVIARLKGLELLDR